MNRYFIDGIEITEQEAKKQEKLNKIYLDSMDLEQWKKIRFIIVIIGAAENKKEGRQNDNTLFAG